MEAPKFSAWDDQKKLPETKMLRLLQLNCSVFSNVQLMTQLLMQNK